MSRSVVTTPNVIDRRQVAKCAAAPESGPRVLFLSGGSALRATSSALKHLTHNSIHLVTPFDSGGSSARLREALGMCAVGDLRNRLIALANDDDESDPSVAALLSHRLPARGDNAKLRVEIARLASGNAPLIARVPKAEREQIQTHLNAVIDALPTDFDFALASVGNLVMAGAYVANGRDIDVGVDVVHSLLNSRGIVRPVVAGDLHLLATLEDGETIAGQHAITSRTTSTRPKICELALVADIANARPTTIEAPAETLAHIERSDGICFPMGSFFSSVLANLLPQGVGESVAKASGPKIFVPNMVGDVEQRGLSVSDAVDHLVRLVARDVERSGGGAVTTTDVVNTLIVDDNDTNYSNLIGLRRLADEGVNVIRAPLVHPTKALRLCPQRLSELLVSLVAPRVESA